LTLLSGSRTKQWTISVVQELFGVARHTRNVLGHKTNYAHSFAHLHTPPDGSRFSGFTVKSTVLLSVSVLGEPVCALLRLSKTKTRAEQRVKAGF